ncbi:MAG: phosphoribosylglycinamide formyltransferase [Gemmatimonas sp.]|nr:phosphoribosylglycinamide formyltransferase [Gemmatimonas sp.]
MSDPALARLRDICLAQPGAAEVLAWETSTFRVGKIFAMYAQPSDSKHSGGRPGVWLKVAPGVQSLMLADRPDRFYFPPYVGKSGWIGVWLDQRVSWKEVALLVEDSWRLMAPARLRKAHDAPSPRAASRGTKPSPTRTKGRAK